ncbi:MAG: HD domain-containing protein [Lachnospiraceae bacterium]|nr:HD domain-containing protein [Lachnospiraceae bacterium]
MSRTGIGRLFVKRKNITALLVCVAGIVLNIVLGQIVSMFGLPLYLDTVGTVTVAVLGGYLPGVFVGFVTNVIKGFFDSSSLYYGVLNVLIAGSAAFLARRGFFKNIRGEIFAALLFTLIGGGLGSLIPWFMDWLEFDSESLSGVLYTQWHFDLFPAHLLSSLITDLPDKFVTVILVRFLLYIIPEKFYRYCGFSMWMQSPESGQGKEIQIGSNVRLVSLRIKMLIVLLFSLTTVAVVSTVISVRVYYKTSIEDHERLAQGTATLAAGIIDGNMVDEYITKRGRVTGYEETKSIMRDILSSTSEISYLYFCKMEEDGYHVVLDIDTEKTPAYEIGEIVEYEGTVSDLVPFLLAGEEVDPVITRDDYGELITAMKPVFDSNGKCVCYAIAEVDIQMIIEEVNSFLMEMISVFLSFFILLCAFVMWLTDYNVIYPIRTITETIDTFSSDSQENMDDDVKAFRKIGVHTGDEIEKLYNSLCRMTLDQTEQIRSIRRLSDSTAKMQDGLIITMADMVENRDSDTGAHIQKTAAYVKIILAGLEAKGYYAEKLTPKFISDTIRSAPLHDVGKINIPDGVLNKPGKLTDEEFEIMKTHTTAGKRIMEQAILTVKGDNYLKEARNMAAYHHERWDGKGYPEGIHGEVIPLSARIMAVADVFDALTSPRVYKPAFPLEKALSIIDEGKGSQFDPKVVEAFMDSLDEVKVILRKYNQDV